MANKLYVGNFPWSTTEGELEELFSQYGELKSVKVIMDKETGRSRGFAFIEFADAAAAQDAMENENGRDMGGRELKVREAVDKPRENRDSRPREPRPPRQETQAPPADRSGGNGGAKRHRERPARREDRDRY